jgi:DNA-directed RNA polymerase specialized sigma24 family protein
VAVKRMLIDLNAYRRTKVTISADKEVDGDDDNSENLYNTLADNVNVQDEVTARLDVMQVINALDDTKGTAVGISPLLGESKLNEKTVLLHVLEGYNVTEIAAMYKNPTTGKPVAKTYVSRLIKNCRQYF